MQISLEIFHSAFGAALNFSRARNEADRLKKASFINSTSIIEQFHPVALIGQNQVILYHPQNGLLCSGRSRDASWHFHL